MGFADFLGVISGQDSNEVSEKMLFNSVIGFRGIVDGVGCSTFVQSLAKAFSDRTSKRICVVDTNILYPSQYTMLCDVSSDMQASMKDWFTVEAPLTERILDSRYHNVCVLGLYNRKITDVYSSLDTLRLVENTFDKLKDLFDIILVDLSHEWSQVAMGSAIQCNKIFTICDLSSRCLNSLQLSLTNLATSAVPFGKCRDTIVNKYSVKGRTGVEAIISRSKLNVVATIPFSPEIYIQGTLNKCIWDSPSQDDGVVAFNDAVDEVLVSLVNETPLDIIDMAEMEGFELEVMNATMKNKSKLRKKLKKTRNPILSPATPEVMQNAKNKRHKDYKKRMSKGEFEQEEKSAIDEGFSDMSGYDTSDYAQTGYDQSSDFDASADFSQNFDYEQTFNTDEMPVGYDQNGNPVYDISQAYYDAEGQPLFSEGG